MERFDRDANQKASADSNTYATAVPTVPLLQEQRCCSFQSRDDKTTHHIHYQTTTQKNNFGVRGQLRLHFAPICSLKQGSPCSCWLFAFGSPGGCLVLRCFIWCWIMILQAVW
mmetsp:Transcript_59646/g.134590  ORF Transcript_59646/g.134590 Transcript_59646/m.134590 type:complete len:113 (-) Transcript_59646:1166-1504(-)